MKPSDYRKKVAAAVGKAAKRARRGVAGLRKGATPGGRLEVAPLESARDRAAARKIATDRHQPAEKRALALNALGPLMATDSALLKMAIKILGNDQEPVAVRTAALQVLKAASFHVPNFGDHRAEFVVALRSAALVNDKMLRERSLGVLARDKDGPTLKRLEGGLREPKKALVSAEKALQLLSYDTKRDPALLKEIIKDPPSEDARYQALRNLAADVQSKPLFEGILKDKTESKQARLIAMAALQSLEPDRLHQLSGAIVTDETDDEDIRAAGLVAAATFGHSTAATEALTKGAEKLQARAGSHAAKEAARRYLTKAAAAGEPDET